jgi:hypothetical protein
MQSNMIVGRPHESGAARRAESSCVDGAAALHLSRRGFSIKSADSNVHRHSADLLLKRRYGWRGYHAVSLPADQTAHRFTLTVTEGHATIGTITVGLDGFGGLNCEDAFAPEIEALRTQGRRLCEFTKLAVDTTASTKPVLAALFHGAHIVAHRVRRSDTLVMEVNPRHVRYYERMLGAHAIGEERHNRAVNAPAVLLSISFEYIKARIAEFGGRPELAATERSLYPFALTPGEENIIIEQLMSIQEPASRALN